MLLWSRLRQLCLHSAWIWRGHMLLLVRVSIPSGIILTIANLSQHLYTAFWFIWTYIRIRNICKLVVTMHYFFSAPRMMQNAVFLPLTFRLLKGQRKNAENTMNYEASTENIWPLLGLFTSKIILECQWKTLIKCTILQGTRLLHNLF